LEEELNRLQVYLSLYFTRSIDLKGQCDEIFDLKFFHKSD